MMKTMTVMIATSALMTLGCGEERKIRSYLFEEPVSYVDVDVESADVYLSGSDVSSSRVELDMTYRGSIPDYGAAVVNQELRVGMGCEAGCWDLHGRADLFVPEKVDTDIDCGSGDVHIAGLDGDLWADLGSGDLEVVEHTGNLDVSIGSGRIFGTEIAADDLYLDTGSGDVELSLDLEPFFLGVDVGSGDVDIELPAGDYDIRIDSGSGDVDLINIDDDPGSEYEIRIDVGSGDVRIYGY